MKSANQVMSARWKPGDMPRYVTHSALRCLILDEASDGKYCVLTETGVVTYIHERDLLSLDEWLAWWEKFRDDFTGRDWRKWTENAAKAFVAPPWWNEAMARARAGLDRPEQNFPRLSDQDGGANQQTTTEVTEEIK